MTIFAQEIIVCLILALSVAWIIRRIVKLKKNVSSCNCDGCPFADCAMRENMDKVCKKVDKKVAQSDK